MNLIYRKLQKRDAAAIKSIINESFGLYRYVADPGVLDSFLNVYLYSCLSEATFIRVAEQDGQVIGVIMGNAKSDYRLMQHLKPILAMGYHSAAMSIKALLSREGFGDYKRMHQIYHELKEGCGQSFDGVLTLFAVTEDCRGLGVGKELLHRLLTYQKEQQTRSIYLYTDSTCNVGFYESQGFARLGEQAMSLTRDRVKAEMDVYLYGLQIK